MAAGMTNRLEPVELHNERKQQLKIRLLNSRMPDLAYKLVNPTLTFNMSLEPALMFTLCTFADKTEDL
jgi:hypothetical protein